jgi:hypothetical protein
MAKINTGAKECFSSADKFKLPGKRFFKNPQATKQDEDQHS